MIPLQWNYYFLLGVRFINENIASIGLAIDVQRFDYDEQ